MKVGDLYWIDFPSTNGHEQSGRRPGLIIGDESAFGRLPMILTVPLTGVVSKVSYPGTLLVSPTATNGLTKESLLLIFQLKAVDRMRISSRIGILDPVMIQQIHAIIDQLLGRQAATGATP